MGCEWGCKTETIRAPALREMKLEFLYLDEAACEPCGETAQTVKTAAEAARGPLEAIGGVLNIEKKHITSRALATKERLPPSPTIRVDGGDVDPAVTEDDCPSGGTLAGDDTKVGCRVWHWRGEVFSAAPVGKIVESLMAAAMATQHPMSWANSHCPKTSNGFSRLKRKGKRLGADPQALEQAFRMFRERLLRMIAKRVGNEPDAQDVLQEVFVRALRSGNGDAQKHCLKPLVKALPAPYRQALTYTDLEGGGQADYAPLNQLKPFTARACAARAGDAAQNGAWLL